MNTLNQVASTIPGAKSISILGAGSVFRHIKLNVQSSYHTSFTSTYGINELSNCWLIYVINTADHDRNRKIVLYRLREYISVTQCKQTRIPNHRRRMCRQCVYMERTTSGSGKATAINEIPAPKDKVWQISYLISNKTTTTEHSIPC